MSMAAEDEPPKMDMRSDTVESATTSIIPEPLTSTCNIDPITDPAAQPSSDSRFAFNTSLLSNEAHIDHTHTDSSLFFDTETCPMGVDEIVFRNLVLRANEFGSPSAAAIADALLACGNRGGEAIDYLRQENLPNKIQTMDSVTDGSKEVGLTEESEVWACDFCYDVGQDVQAKFKCGDCDAYICTLHGRLHGQRRGTANHILTNVSLPINREFTKLLEVPVWLEKWNCFQNLVWRAGWAHDKQSIGEAAWRMIGPGE